MPNALEVRDLHKRFGKVEVLCGASFDVPAGEIVSFLGRNGAGKTTALRTIMGMLRADAGTLCLFAETVRAPTLRQKQRIGFVSQEQNFYPWMNALQLARLVGGLYPTWDHSRFLELLERFDIPADRRASALSGGTRVKLALCLALAPRPDLLVLDEPTSGLDPAARRELLDLVLAQAREDGRTTLFSTHIVEEAERVSDRVAVLDGGRVLYEGSVAALRDSLRDVHAGAELAVPSGFQVVGRRQEKTGPVCILRAVGASWSDWPTASPTPQVPTLEDAFLALTVHRVDDR